MTHETLVAHVVTPARLHFALVDLCGHRGRIDGSIGLAVEQPGVEVYAQRSETFRLTGDLAEPVRHRAHQIGEHLLAFHSLPGIDVELRRTIPLHIGLGAGTQLSLGLARALYALYELPWDTVEVARLVGRGGTSGVGVSAFEQGGVILDGGHTFPGTKQSFLPSSAAQTTPPPPVLLRYAFPDWPLLLVTPHCEQISGEDEVQRFQTLCPLSPETAERNAHLILMKILPALVEEDLPAFCEGLNQLQEIGWKKVEHEAQGKPVYELRELLFRHGATGVALSSWGPTMAVFGGDLRKLEEVARTFCDHLPEGGTVICTRANNRGATCQVMPAP